jgi:hypothetical protein
MGTFETERLPLAIFLHADGRLAFLRCERVTDLHVAFIFDDPHLCGDQIQYEFESGAALPVSKVFAAQGFLRRKMSDALNTRKPKNVGEQNDSRIKSCQ